MIYQKGFKGGIRVWDRFFPKRWNYQQLWCVIEVPEKRWFDNAYLWIGFWTNLNHFLQVGLFPMAPTSNIGSAHPGEYAIMYNVNDYGFLDSFDIEVYDGDKIILTIDRIAKGLWKVSAINTTHNQIDYQDFEDYGDSFSAQDLSVMFEGYTDSKVSTHHLGDGVVRLSSFTVQDMSGRMVNLAKISSHNPEGETWIGSKKFKAPPEWLRTELSGRKIIFRGI